MSYKTWNMYGYGYGFCVDNINTTPEKLLQLAAMNPEVLKDVQDMSKRDIKDIFRSYISVLTH